MSLLKIRKEISELDAQILQLLNQRLEKSLLSRQFKTVIEDDNREKEIKENLKKQIYGLLDYDFCCGVFERIMMKSKELQTIDKKIVAFQGEHGAYSEMAASHWQQNIITMPCPGFVSVLNGLFDGSYDYAILPVENSLGGFIDEVNRLLITSEVQIVGAVDMPIVHCLLANPQADHRQIREVYSHPQALKQCVNFLARNALQPIESYDTAGSALNLSSEKRLDKAVIASSACAEIYNLDILKEGIQDSENNRTRFFVLALKSSSTAGNKCSIVLTTENRAGTLFKVLELFAGAQINLSRIESVPISMGNYAFFIDFSGSAEDLRVQTILHQLEAECRSYKMLGCYNERIL